MYGTPLKSVNYFTYLDNTIASDKTIDMDINNRRRAASGTFGGLWKRVWSQHGITISTKCQVYKTIVLPTLLCSAEKYTLYRRHIRKLSQVHLRHLQQILGISWKDHISRFNKIKQDCHPKQQVPDGKWTRMPLAYRESNNCIIYV